MLFICELLIGARRFNEMQCWPSLVSLTDSTKRTIDRSRPLRRGLLLIDSLLVDPATITIHIRHFQPVSHSIHVTIMNAIFYRLYVISFTNTIPVGVLRQMIPLTDTITIPIGVFLQSILESCSIPVLIFFQNGTRCQNTTTYQKKRH
jgi:hypothetical protein